MVQLLRACALAITSAVIVAIGALNYADPEARNRRIFDLWMACYSQEEIAKREDVTKDTVSQICQVLADLPKSDKALAEQAL
jgi:hypothetical protein